MRRDHEAIIATPRNKLSRVRLFHFYDMNAEFHELLAAGSGNNFLLQAVQQGEILTWLDEKIHELGTFSDTDWSQRSVVEIAAAPKTQGWFLHALTGQEWLLRLVFRVGKNAFKQGELVQRLGIKPLNETPGLEVRVGLGDQAHLALQRVVGDRLSRRAGVRGAARRPAPGSFWAA